MEEATLRAKIQAMKNLLEVKRQSAKADTAAATSYSYKRPKYGQYQAKNFASASGPVNRSWNRFSTPAAPPTVNRSLAGNGSANKVWRREGAPLPTTKTPPPAPVATVNKAWKRPMKVTANVIKSRQVQVLRLEDGEYSKANGGFSLVRAGVKKPTVVANASRAVTAAKPMPVARSNSNSVHIGGVKYVVANGGKVLKRCTAEECKTSAVFRPGSISLTTKSGAARAALLRAKTTVQRARNKRFRTKNRTVYCSYYNRFGYCKNKDECRFIHDSRRVAMCRKFLKNECSDPKCLLSHQNDKNKVPDCKMFLRGACAREGCKYRHVKVSATAELCEPFTKGYCPKGVACPLRHELPPAKRKSPTAAAAKQHSATVSGTLSSSCSTTFGASGASPASSTPTSSSGSPNTCNNNAELSIRPNIRFASKHNAGFPSLFDGLRRTAK